MTRKKYLNMIGYFSSYVVLGIVTAILGPSLPHLADQISTNIQNIGTVFIARYSGYIVGSYTIGRQYDRLPGNRLLSLMLFFVAVSMVFIPFTATLYGLLISLFILGVSQGGLDVGGNTLLAWSRNDNLGPYMNALHFFFGLGSTLSPLLVSFALLKYHDISSAFWLCSVLTLPIIFLLSRVPGPEKVSGFQRNQIAFNRTGILLVAIFLFFYIGSEASFAGWIYTYSRSLKMLNDQSAAYLTSAFWLSITAGRIIAIPIIKRLKPSVMQILVLLSSLLSLSLLIFIPDSVFVLWVSVITTGLFMASVFPTTITFAKRRINITGEITGLFLIGSNSGAMIVPWLVGRFFTQRDPRLFPILLIANTFIALIVFIFCSIQIPDKTNRQGAVIQDF